MVVLYFIDMELTQAKLILVNTENNLVDEFFITSE